MRAALELQPCCGERSGIGIYAYELAKRLRDREDLAFCGNLFNFLGRNDNSAALAGIAMPVRESRWFPYGVYRRIWNVVPIPYERLFPGEAELSIFFNYIVPPRVRGKVITAVHDLTYLRYPETMEPRNRRRLRSGMEHSIAASDMVITVSAFSRREIVELLGVPEERVAVVYDAPSLGECKDAGPASLPGKLGIEEPYLLYVGTIEPRKNLTRLLKAFERLKREEHIPHRLVLAGGKGWANSEIYKTAAAMKDVIFTGYVSEGEKAALYAHADAFLFPSLYEGFGIPPLEAMHYGCPVVCSGTASLPEVVGDAAELTDPLDETAIAAGIWRVISDRAYADELVRRGYEQERKYTWTASAEKLTEICRAVLGLT